MKTFLKTLTFVFIIAIVSCNNSVKQEEATVIVETSDLAVKYAQGFNIVEENGITVISVSQAWPGVDKEYKYALLKSDQKIKNTQDYDAIVHIPIQNIVVTSTTHIPSLEMLGEDNSLSGFPNLQYISSPKTRAHINNGAIVELGKNEDINTEILIDLAPDAVVGFAIDGNNTTFNTLGKMGVPVLFNGDWTEKSPLGKAEWVKFFGALYDKQKEADSIFTTIEKEYLGAKKLASQATQRPTVLSGAMYKDVWYLPQGDSWAAQFIADAHGDYIFNESTGTGSQSLNIESVYEQGENADLWIGPGQFSSFNALNEAHPVYSKFKAFKTGDVYSFTSLKGETGGVLYYELAPNRPDIVLKDMIKIIHPSLLPAHKLYFFTKLN